MGQRSAAADAALAIEGFVDSVRKAWDLVSRGEAVSAIEALIARAEDLLDIVDEALLELDPHRHRELIESGSGLRVTLEPLRDELLARR